MHNEKERIDNKREQVLRVLRSAGDKGVTNAELSKISLRYGGHLGKFYEQGYKIDKEFIGDGLYRYILVEEPSTIIVREKAIDVLMAEVSKLGSVNKDTLKNLMEENSIAVRYKPNTYK